MRVQSENAKDERAAPANFARCQHPLASWELGRAALEVHNIDT